MSTTTQIFDSDGTMIDFIPHYQKSWTTEGGDEGLAAKPGLAIFLEAARRMNAEAAKCISLEDAPFGIEAARHAGIKAGTICTSHSDEELKGSRVLVHVHDYNKLTNSKFPESLYAS